MDTEQRLPIGQMNVMLEQDALALDNIIEEMTLETAYGICAECGAGAEFDCTGSECCGANPYDSDPDTDMER